MKLFLDQNISHRIALALFSLGIRDVANVFTLFPETLRTGRTVTDEEWLAAVGGAGWLAVTRDRRILSSPPELEQLIRHDVGMVILQAASPSNFDVLRFLMQRWDWLREIDAGQPRPFVFSTTLDGEPELVDLGAL